jgi:hypothetical protein
MGDKEGSFGQIKSNATTENNNTNSPSPQPSEPQPGYLHPERIVESFVPRILALTMVVGTSVLRPNLNSLPQSLLLAQRHYLILMNKLHNLLLLRLPGPMASFVLGLLLSRLEDSLSDLAAVILLVGFFLVEFVADVGVAVEEGAQVDSTTFTEAVSVVSWWGVGYSAGGTHVGVGELVGLSSCQ